MNLWNTVCPHGCTSPWMVMRVTQRSSPLCEYLMGIRARRGFLCLCGESGAKRPPIYHRPPYRRIGFTPGDGFFRAFRYASAAPQLLKFLRTPRVLFVLVILQTRRGRKKSRIAVINEIIFAEHQCSAPLHIPALLPPPPPLCIIHHIGLLPCFPGLFLPSMPATLTESPQSPAAPNSKPLSIWITDYIPLFPPLLSCFH